MAQNYSFLLCRRKLYFIILSIQSDTFLLGPVVKTLLFGWALTLPFFQQSFSLPFNFHFQTPKHSHSRKGTEKKFHALKHNFTLILFLIIQPKSFDNLILTLLCWKRLSLFNEKTKLYKASERNLCMEKTHQSLVNGMIWEKKNDKKSVHVFRKLLIFSSTIREIFSHIFLSVRNIST